MFSKDNKENNTKDEKKKSVFVRVLKWLCIGIISLIILVVLTIFIVRSIGRAIYNKTPEGGINESMYIDINNSKQWISIYGQDKNNPVILYLHGGPGDPSSPIDYRYVRKWADVFTVVTWDQRNCGLSYSDDQNNTPLTYDLFMKDGIEMTRYIMNYLHKDKITLIGHSWGTYYGCHLIMNYPEYYNYYIGTGQLIDIHQNELAFVEVAKEWVKGNKEDEKLVAKLNPNKLDDEYYAINYELLKKYGYDYYSDKSDYSRFGAYFFNPHHSLLSVYNYHHGNVNDSVYKKFRASPEFDKFSLLNKTEYAIPYYNINGKRDYITNHVLAEEYFNIVKAPRKKLYTMDTGHGLLEMHSGEFSDIVHEIVKLEQTNTTIASN
jgi:pimeloyl-ACP methyl ester carboxylesterase